MGDTLCDNNKNDGLQYLEYYLFLNNRCRTFTDLIMWQPCEEQAGAPSDFL